MPRKPKQTGNYADLPVLTEPSETSVHLPILTEKLPEEEDSPQLPLSPPPQAAPAGPAISDEQYRQLAERIAPRLEQALQEKFSSRLQAIWPEIWSEVQAELPRLLRELIAESTRHARK